MKRLRGRFSPSTAVIPRVRARVEPLGIVPLRRKLIVYIAVVAATIAALLAPFLASGVPLSRLAGYLRVLSMPTSVFNIAKYTAAMLLTGLAGVIAFRSRVWNIGLEGYMIIGAIATLAAAHMLSGGGVALLVFEALIALLAAGAYGGVVAALYLLGINEVVSSMMLYYVAVYLLLFTVYRVWPSAYGGFPYSPLPGPEQPVVLRVPAMLYVAVLLAVVLELFYRYTLPGFIARLVGSNERAARLAGYRPRLAKVLVLIASSALAGLAGFHEASVKGFVDRGFASLGYGFAGITVAFLASLRPIYVIPAALLMGFMYHFGGYASMYVQGGFAAYFYYLQGILLLAVIAARTLPRYRIIVEVASRG